MDLRLFSTPLTKAQKIAVCPLADAKLHARVTHNDEDALLEDYIEAAYDFLSGPDGWLGRCCLLQEDWEYFAHSDLARAFELPMRPFAGATITTFGWIQGDGTYLNVSPGTFRLVPGETMAYIESYGGSIWPYVGLPYSRAYRLVFKAGFTPPDEPEGVPSPIVLAMKMLVSVWYRDREMLGQADDRTNRGLMQLAGRYRIGPDHS